MEEASPQAAQGKDSFADLVAVSRALEVLRANWGGQYGVGYDAGHGYWATRHGVIGHIITADDPDELDRLIAAATVSQRPAWPLVSALPPLAPFVSVPQVARAHVGVTCTEWDLAPLAEDARLVVSELSTNAINASTGEDGNPHCFGGWRMPVVTLRLLSDGVQLLIEVHDEAPGQPLLIGAGGDAVSGRGLGIVNELSASWGWHPVPGGKCCWAVLREDG
jgi:hypothetical protein